MLTKKQKKVLNCINYIPQTPKQIAENCGYNESAYIYDALRALLKKELIAKQGSGRYTKYYKL